MSNQYFSIDSQNRFRELSLPVDTLEQPITSFQTLFLPPQKPFSIENNIVLHLLFPKKILKTRYRT